VEAQNFSVRKHLLEYDDVMNKQRENIYALRRQVLEGEIKFEGEDGEGEENVDSRGYLMSLAEDSLDGIVATYAAKDADFEEWDLPALKREAERTFSIDTDDFDFTDLSADEIGDLVWERVKTSYAEKEQLVGRDILQRVERDVMLQVVDGQWKDHLYSLDHLKEGIGLRGYGQRDPLVEYKKESFTLFQAMKERIDQEIVRLLWGLRPMVVDQPEAEGAAAPPRPAAAVPRPAAPPRRATPLTLNNPAESVPAFAAPRPSPAATLPVETNRQPARVGGDDAPVKTVKRDEPKVGRNDPCPCGSGKKYKKCHGTAA
jgi:preprotein translocase subunit SecA